MKIIKKEVRCFVCEDRIDTFRQSNFRKRVNYPFGRNSKARRSYVHRTCDANLGLSKGEKLI